MSEFIRLKPAIRALRRARHFELLGGALVVLMLPAVALLLVSVLVGVAVLGLLAIGLLTTARAYFRLGRGLPESDNEDTEEDEE